MASKGWKGRIAQLAAMDRAEILARVRQYSGARVDGLRYRLKFNFPSEVKDIKELASASFFFGAAQVPSLCALLKERLPHQVGEIVSRGVRACQHRFDLLGYEGLDYGTEIDWHSDRVHGKLAPRKLFYEIQYLNFEEVGDSKVTWELNRHQHFVTLAKAYRLTGDEKYVREIFAQWTHWHKENPYPRGLNWASSLEVGFRSLSWVWTFFLLQECPLFTAQLRAQWQNALNLNGRHLETYL